MLNAHLDRGNNSSWRCATAAAAASTTTTTTTKAGARLVRRRIKLSSRSDQLKVWICFEKGHSVFSSFRFTEFDFYHSDWRRHKSVSKRFLQFINILQLPYFTTKLYSWPSFSGTLLGKIDGKSSLNYTVKSSLVTSWIARNSISLNVDETFGNLFGKVDGKSSQSLSRQRMRWNNVCEEYFSNRFNCLVAIPSYYWSLYNRRNFLHYLIPPF